jgi:hypothetical protein
LFLTKIPDHLQIELSNAPSELTEEEVVTSLILFQTKNQDFFSAIPSVLTTLAAGGLLPSL